MLMLKQGQETDSNHCTEIWCSAAHLRSQLRTERASIYILSRFFSPHVPEMFSRITPLLFSKVGALHAECLPCHVIHHRVHAPVLCRETVTAPVYRLFSIDDNHPGMVKVAEGGASVAVEVSPPR